MLQVSLPHFLVVGALLFALGLVTVSTRRNAVGVLMGVELLLNAANINFVAFARFSPGFEIEGMVFALMVIVLAAGEAARAVILDAGGAEIAHVFHGHDDRVEDIDVGRLFRGILVDLFLQQGE